MTLNVIIDTIQDLVVPRQLLESIKFGKLLNGESINVRLRTIQFISNMLLNYSKIYDEIKKSHSEIEIQSRMASYFVNVSE